MKIFTLDNTFGYNPGRAVLSFSLADRLAIIDRLDHLGIDYVEAGCPGASKNAAKFFEYARTECPLSHARLVATARLDTVHGSGGQDPEIAAVLDAGVPTVTLSANCWHTAAEMLAEYCRKIGDTVRRLKAHGLEVIFRNENFFHSYERDPRFALHTLEAAKTAGADVLCLRDATGSPLPHLVREICLEVRKRFDGTLGICAHDDSDLALANTLEAVEQGFTHVEGSLNAYGGRRGLANLCSIISNLENKLGHTTIGVESLAEMPGIARLMAQAGELALERRAAVHDAGATPAKVSALDQVDPKLVADLSATERFALIERMRALEEDGFVLLNASGTVELLVREALHPDLRPFVAERYDLMSHSALYGGAMSTATATVRIGDTVRSETEDGDGAVNALERSLRQCLFAVYPEIANVHVTGFRVEVIDPAEGTAARARVLLEWTEGTAHWVTQGVSPDLVEATWLALVDGFRLPLLRGEAKYALPRAMDTSWAV